MQVLGLQVVVKGAKRLVLGVLIDPATTAVVDTFEHISDSRHGEAERTREARDALSSSLRAHQVEAAVLLEADYHPRAKVTGGTKDRLRLEGACLSACRDHVASVIVMNGPALGKACGGTKDAAIDAGGALGLNERFAEAAAAALAAQSLLS